MPENEMTEHTPAVASPAANGASPLTFEQEVHALLWRGIVFARDLLGIIERESAALHGEERRVHRLTIDHLRADVARFEAVIPKATEWRDAAAASSAPLSAAMTASNTLAFFASVIKSGEPWTTVCAEAFTSAKADLAGLTADRDRLARRVEALEVRWATFRQAVLATDAMLQRIARVLVEMDEPETAGALRALALQMFVSVQDEAIQTGPAAITHSGAPA